MAALKCCKIWLGLGYLSLLQAFNLFNYLFIYLLLVKFMCVRIIYESTHLVSILVMALVMA